MKEEINLDKISETSKINGTILVPMAYGDLSMKDIIESHDSLGVVKFYPADSLLYIQYKHIYHSQTAEELIELKDLSFSKDIQSSYPGFPLIFPATFPGTIYEPLDLTNKERLDSLFLKSGSLSITVQSTFRNTGSIKLKVPGLTKGGVAFEKTINITTSNGTFVSAPIIEPLAGYKFQLYENGGNSNNVKIEFEITLQSGAAISPSYAITLTTNITDLGFSRLYGYIGNRQLFDDIGKISMNLFDIDEQLNLQFANPQIKLTSINSFGVPMQIDFHDMRIFSSLNKQYYDLTLNPSTYTLGKAVSFTQPAYDTILINSGNSNLNTAMTKIPSEVYYGIKATANPIGTPQNFAYDTSSIDAKFDVELPLELKMSQYEVNRDFDLGLDEAIEDYSIIDTLIIYNKIENWLPIKAHLQVLLVDTLDDIVDSLYTSSNQPVIQPGEIGTTGKNKGRVIKPNTKEFKIVFVDKRIMQFGGIKKIILRIILNTADYENNTYVKFYLSNRIKVALGARAVINIKDPDQL